MSLGWAPLPSPSPGEMLVMGLAGGQQGRAVAVLSVEEGVLHVLLSVAELCRVLGRGGCSQSRSQWTISPGRRPGPSKWPQGRTGWRGRRRRWVLQREKRK